MAVTGELLAEMLCHTNLNGLTKAMLIYMGGHDRPPTPAKWCDLLMQDGEIDARAFRCRGVQRSDRRFVYPLEFYLWSRCTSPGEPGGPSDYAMNKHIEEVGDAVPPDMVMLFDAQAGWNQSGGPELLRPDNHGGAGCNVVFGDSHVEFLKTENLRELEWKP